MLKKAWLEDFCEFVQPDGNTTAKVIGRMLTMDAAFRVLLVA